MCAPEPAASIDRGSARRDLEAALTQQESPEARIRALESRIVELEAELAALRVESRTRERELGQADARARELDRDLRQAAAAVERARGRRAVRVADAMARLVRRPIRSVRRARARLADRGRRLLPRLGLRRSPRRRRGIERQNQLAARIQASLPEAPVATGSVTVLVEARSDADSLRKVLMALRDVDWPDLEVFVTGPAADRSLRAATRGEEWSASGQQRIRAVGGTSFAEARREALAIAAGEDVLLLHDDVSPVEPTWLRRMAAALHESGAGAVGARLLLPTGAVDPSGAAAPLTVAHLGIAFSLVDGMPHPTAIGRGTDPMAPDAAARTVRPAASEACLLIARTTLDAVGLPRDLTDDDEPVELCLRLRAAGRAVVVEGTAVLWHRDAFTEHLPSAVAPGALAQALVGSLMDRWGPSLSRSVLTDLLLGAKRWSDDALRVGIALSKDDEAAGFGDYYTAHELGDELERLGWSVTYLERHLDRWYAGLGELDVVVSMLPQFDLLRIPRHIVAVAWIRSWTEDWISRSWFGNYDLVLVSSGRSREIVEERSPKRANLFPIATNPGRFHPGEAVAGLESDATFVGSYWGAPRAAATALPELATRRRVAVFGRGWEGVPGMAQLSRGLAPYDRVPDIYTSTSIVVDDAVDGSNAYASMNSRVFDGLAAGAMVVTNNLEGARELFDADFPTWSDAAELGAVVDRLLAEPDRRAALTDRYRRVVLDRHTYERRASELRDLLVDWVTARRVAIHIGPQTWEAGKNWGDVPFGRDVQRQLERRGIPAAVLVHEEAHTAAAVRADVALHIFGVRAPRGLRAQCNALWVISHPDRITEAMCEAYDVIFMASDVLLRRLTGRISPPLVSLHQATEPSRFYPDPTGPHHQLLFVGNSRRVQRPIIEALRDTPFDLAVYGADWTPELLDPRHLRGEWIANDELRRYYSTADIVLNDHWGDMRDLGIISNRVYDALACGAFVVSDRVPGIDEEFDGAVATFTTADELDELIRRSLADPAGRGEAAARGRAAVLERHTFSQRVERILEEVTPLLDGRPATVDPPGDRGGAG